MNNSENTSKSKWRVSPLFLVSLIIFLLIFTGIFFPGRPRFGPGLKRKAAKMQIAAFEEALKMFKEDNGFYPTGINGLNDLVVKPVGVTNWHQYLDNIFLDYWGHPYLYECPGKHRPDSYDLSSAGPDGKFGTEDDIVNWKLPEK